MNLGINIGLGSAALMGRGPTPARIGAMSGVTSWAHWPLHPALNRSLGTVVATLPAWASFSEVNVTGGTVGGRRRIVGTTTSNPMCTRIAATSIRTGPARWTVRFSLFGSQRWVALRLNSTSHQCWFDCTSGAPAVGTQTGCTGAIVQDGSDYVCTISATLADVSDYCSVFLCDADASTTATCPPTDGIDLAEQTATECLRQSALQSIGDEGPRAAHLVMSTPGNQPDYNAWDASGSQGGIAGARHPSGYGRYADAVDAVLGQCLRATTHYVVSWSLFSATPGMQTAAILDPCDSAGNNLDWFPCYATPNTVYRARSSSTTLSYGTSSVDLKSRVAVRNGAAGALYLNGDLVGSEALASISAISSDRVRLFRSATGFEALWLGGGMFIFSSAAAMTAALPSIHAMVAYMRALWGL